MNVHAFASGRLSNWHPCKFIDEDGQTYCSNEQYFIYKKAILFGDTDAASAIMNTNNCKDIKAIGRRVKNFDETVWAKHRERIMTIGIWLKFSQNPKLKTCLLNTGDMYIVEASPWDKIWGSGLGVSDSRIVEPSKWPGLNLLGNALMRVRCALRDTNNNAVM